MDNWEIKIRIIRQELHLLSDSLAYLEDMKHKLDDEDAQNAITHMREMHDKLYDFLWDEIGD